MGTRTPVTFFMVLAGFTCVVAYGDKFPVYGDKSKKFPLKKFYWNRWVRTMPLYYLYNLIQIPFLLAVSVDGWAPPGVKVPSRPHFAVSLLITLIPISMWVPVASMPCLVPSWFISAVLGMWLLWPLHHQHTKSISDRWLVFMLILSFLI